MLKNRIEIAKEDSSLIAERRLFSFLMKRLATRKDMDKTKDFLNRLELKQLIKKTWGMHREIPVFAEKSFSEMWKEINNIDQ